MTFVSAFRLPASVSDCILIADVAFLGFGLMVELAARNVEYATFAAVGGEVAFDDMGRGTLPGAVRLYPRPRLLLGDVLRSDGSIPHLGKPLLQPTGGKSYYGKAR